MKTKPLQNYDSSVGLEVYDIDWKCEEELLELGRLCSSQCIVYLNEDISVNLIENALLNIAVQSRSGSSQFNLMYEEAWQKSGATREDVLIAMGQMITLGRELFIFHLIASEIKLRSQS